MAFWGALLASAAVHLPVYAFLGFLAGAVSGKRVELPARPVPFEVADLGREDEPEEQARPVELPVPVRPDPPRERLKPKRIAPLEREPAPLPESGQTEADEAGAAEQSAEENTTAVPVESTAAEGAVAVPTARSGGRPGLAIGASSQRSSGHGAKGGLGRARAGGGVRAAIPLVRVEPRYPVQAARDGVQGWVRLRFDISPTGKVENPEVVEAHPPGVFERAVLKAVRSWKYRPMIRDGAAVRRSGVKIKLTFKLEQEM